MSRHPSGHHEVKDDRSKPELERNAGHASNANNELKDKIDSANRRFHDGLGETNVHKDPFSKTGRNIVITSDKGSLAMKLKNLKKGKVLEKKEPTQIQQENVRENQNDSQVNPLNIDLEDPNHNDNNRREGEENQPQDQVAEVQPGSNRDNLCCKCLTDTWKFFFPPARADLHIARTITYVTGLYGTTNAFWMATGHQHMGPEAWDIASVGIGLVSGSYVVVRTNTIPRVLAYIREYRARGQAPVPQVREARQGVVTIQGGQPFGPKVDYWRMMKEHAAELEKQGSKSITHDTVISCIMGELRAIGVDIPREEVAKVDVEDMFNHVVAWYDATEPEFWSQCRPEVQGDGMDKDSVVAQLAVIHIYKDMCRFSEELAPDDAWIWPKTEEETSLREQLVQTYKSSGPGSMYDMMSLYRYSQEEIILPRTTACDVVIGALTEIYGS